MRYDTLIALAGDAWAKVGAVYPTGSAYICPEVGPNDYDFILLAQDNDLDALIVAFEDAGWTACKGEDGYPRMEGGWCASRKEDHNVMLTADVVWYTRYAAATELARKMGMKVHNRDVRVALFAAVREGILSDNPELAVAALPSLPSLEDYV